MENFIYNNCGIFHSYVLNDLDGMYIILPFIVICWHESHFPYLNCMPPWGGREAIRV